MKRKKHILVLMVISFLLTIQPSQATGAIVNVGLTDSENIISQSLYLEADNYSVFITIQDGVYSKTNCSLRNRDSTLLFVFTDSDDFYFKSETYRFTIHETDYYSLEFHLYSDWGTANDFVNYEVIITEVDLIIQEKTDIISEAPYGITFILLGVICYVLISRKRKRDSNK